MSEVQILSPRPLFANLGLIQNSSRLLATEKSSGCYLLRLFDTLHDDKVRLQASTFKRETELLAEGGI